MSVVASAADDNDRPKRMAADTNMIEVVVNRFIMIDMGVWKEV